MSKVTMGKGFVQAAVSQLPKGVRFLQGADDGAYIACQSQTKRVSSYNHNARPAIDEGDLIIVTEGGHLYTMKDNSGIKGFGKAHSSNGCGSLLIQRVNIEVVVSTYKAAPAKKKKVAKKKAKKKVLKKKAKTKRY